MVLKAAAAVVLVVVLWMLFRFAMGLRYEKLAREEARRAEELRGRRVLAEIPQPEGGLVLFLEDAEAFYWAGKTVRKRELLGARMLLNGGVIAACALEGQRLPEPAAPEEYEGGERWEVALYTLAGAADRVSCGALREGVSREIAGRVFDAARRLTTDARAGSGSGSRREPARTTGPTAG
jgi:hypothetical protein